MQLKLPGISPVTDPSSPGPVASKRSPEELFEILGGLMEGRLASLVLTANRSRILSSRPARAGSDRLDLRLHGCFLDAAPEVLETVAGYASGSLDKVQRKRALGVLRSHFEANRHLGEEARPARRRAVLRLQPAGRVLDLRHLRDGLNQRFFGGRLEVEITWGRALSRRRRRRAVRETLRLGSYDEGRNLIRVHRVLDDPKVPREVVEAVVYHEMLHADLPAVVVGGRRYSHTREFRRRERLLPCHDRAEEWLEEHLPYLLAARFRRC